MEIQHQFTTIYSLTASAILLIINLLVIRLKKQNWKTLINWKAFVFSFLLVLLGLFYSKTSIVPDWKMQTYGFPQYIFMSKSSSGQDAFLSIGIKRFEYINFIQNLILFYLLINIFMISYKKNIRVS
jgi:hypothetical protein